MIADGEMALPNEATHFAITTWRNPTFHTLQFTIIRDCGPGRDPALEATNKPRRLARAWLVIVPPKDKRVAWEDRELGLRMQRPDLVHRGRLNRAIFGDDGIIDIPSRCDRSVVQTTCNTCVDNRLFCTNAMHEHTVTGGLAPQLIRVSPIGPTVKMSPMLQEPTYVPSADEDTYYHKLLQRVKTGVAQ